ncbi:MAG: hypothetical protein HY247_01820 [archaeon]|nr:MAG: hypothetical protein HY247_01820 [archaeon]
MSEPGPEPEPKLKLTRRSPFAKSLKLCPRCLRPLTGRSRLGGWLIPQGYVCSNCGYTGSVFVEGSSLKSPVESQTSD